MKIGRITVSDRASAGVYTDRSGPEIEAVLREYFSDAVFIARIVPDETDLIAAALAQRNVNRAIQLLENEKDSGALSVEGKLLLAYLYCLVGSVDKAETLVAANAATIKKDSFTDWLWEKLRADFGFHPPAN